ncbi:MAG: hypothetical protein K2X77_31730 [Candidatus Obscuribacterales bacterium]|jgi:tetratricopeptide (TPR) repeat protein|nr:hypothetical protein [Candidatus Obscuribacterales bacterium]
MPELKRFYEALAEFRPAKPVFPKTSELSDYEQACQYWSFGSAVARKKKYELAQKYFEKAILKYPYAWFFYINLAGCYGHFERYDEASNCLKIAIKRALRESLTKLLPRQKCREEKTASKNTNKDKLFKDILRPTETIFNPQP